MHAFLIYTKKMPAIIGKYIQISTLVKLGEEGVY